MRRTGLWSPGSLGARTAAFLIADLSGRALVRLAHVPLGGAHVVRGFRQFVEEWADGQEITIGVDTSAPHRDGSGRCQPAAVSQFAD